MKFFIVSFLIFRFCALAVAQSTVDEDIVAILDMCHFRHAGAAEDAAVASNNLVFRLYKEIIQKNPSKNIVFSPAAISVALAVLEMGSSGSTLRELQSILRPPKSSESDSNRLYQTFQDDIHAGAGLDLEYLTKISNGRLYSADREYPINIANGLFYNEDTNLKPDYADKTRKCFHTEITKASFKENTEGAGKKINAWMSNATNAKITELFKSGTIKSDAVAVIANGLYFKRPWYLKFTRTEEGDFYKFGKTDNTQKVTFLTRSDEYSYATMDNAAIVKIPYKERWFSMYVILPKERDGIKKLEEIITGSTLTSLHFESRQVDLKIPKFEVKSSLDLKKLLQQIGQKEIFTDDADFSRLSETPLEISSAMHEAYFNVNEYGTDSTSANAFILTSGMNFREPQLPVSFIADHPFIFAVIYKPSDAIVLTGRINYLE